MSRSALGLETAELKSIAIGLQFDWIPEFLHWIRKDAEINVNCADVGDWTGGFEEKTQPTVNSRVQQIVIENEQSRLYESIDDDRWKNSVVTGQTTQRRRR